jgi:hypothetical protein
MTEYLKYRLRGECGKSGKHLGPFDPEEDGRECRGCSSAHVDEFGESVGVVQGLTDYNNCKPGDPEYDLDKVGPEWDVRWEPDNLRYAYATGDLERVT